MPVICSLLFTIFIRTSFILCLVFCFLNLFGLGEKLQYLISASQACMALCEKQCYGSVKIFVPP